MSSPGGSDSAAVWEQSLALVRETRDWVEVEAVRLREVAREDLEAMRRSASRAVPAFGLAVAGVVVTALGLSRVAGRLLGLRPEGIQVGLGLVLLSAALLFVLRARRHARALSSTEGEDTST
jgi:hypothetical protein